MREPGVGTFSNIAALEGTHNTEGTEWDSILEILILMGAIRYFAHVTLQTDGGEFFIYTRMYDKEPIPLTSHLPTEYIILYHNTIGLRSKNERHVFGDPEELLIKVRSMMDEGY